MTESELVSHRAIIRDDVCLMTGTGDERLSAEKRKAANFLTALDDVEGLSMVWLLQRHGDELQLPVSLDLKR